MTLSLIGPYLAPPGGAVVLSNDEKTQIQTPDHAQPVLPITFTASEKHTADHARHGTTNRFAAHNIATGEGSVSTGRPGTARTSWPSPRRP